MMWFIEDSGKQSETAGNEVVSHIQANTLIKSLSIEIGISIEEAYEPHLLSLSCQQLFEFIH